MSIRIIQDPINTEQLENVNYNFGFLFNYLRSLSQGDLMDLIDRINEDLIKVEELKFLGPWQNIDEYKTLNIVSYDGGSWIALRDNTGITPVEGDDWAVVATKGEPGDRDETHFTGTNLIANGNFTNGSTGFVAQGGTIQPFTSTTLTFVADGSRGVVGIYTAQGNRFIGKSGHVLYHRVRVRVRDGNAVGFRLYASGGGVDVNLNNLEYPVRRPASEAYYNVSGLITQPAAFEGATITTAIYAAYPSATVASGATMDVFRPLTIDLTETFGAGNEPTAEFMDKMLEKFPNSWFEGTSDIETVKEHMYTLRNQLKNEIEQKTVLKYDKYKYDLQDDFSTAWIPDPTGFITTQNTVEKVLIGQRSLKLTVTNSQNVIRTVERFTNFSLIGKSKQMMVKFYVENPKAINRITLQFSNDAASFANNGRVEFLGNGEGDAATSGGLIRKGWNYLPIVTSATINTGQFSWDLPIMRMRIGITTATQTATVVHFDSFWINGKGNPKIVFTFDDGWKTVYQNAFPLMRAAGIPGTTYVMEQYTDNPENPLSPNYMSLAEMRELHAAGWTIGNHNYAHEIYLLQGLTPTNYVNAAIRNRNWIFDSLLGDGGNHFAYTNGEYDQQVIASLKANGFKSARSAKARGNHPVIVDKPFEIISRAFNASITLSQAQQWIDQAVQSGGTIFLQFHQIAISDVDSTPPNVPSLSWSRDKLSGLIDYIVSLGLTNNCMTHSQWYNEGVLDGTIEVNG